MVDATPNNQAKAFESPETLARFQDSFSVCAKYDMGEQAFELAEVIARNLAARPELPTSDAAVYKEYETLQWKLRWIALPWYREPLIIPLFQDHYILTWQIPDFNLIEKLKHKLVTFVRLEDRNALRKEILEAIRNNTEVLTHESVTKDGKEQAGTVKNWALDEVIALGTQQITSIRLSEYLVNSQNTKALGKESRERLRSFFEFLEYLKTPSDSPAGFESAVPVDDPAATGTIRGGVLEKYSEKEREEQKRMEKWYDIVEKYDADYNRSKAGAAPATVGARTAAEQTNAKPSHLGVENLLKIYSQNPDEQKAIYEEEKNILKRVGREQLNIRPEFEEAIRGNNRNRVIAFLHVLAKTQDLAMVMKTDSVFRDYLKEKYGPESLTQFDAQPTDPVFYSLWLQYLLKQRLQMLESDSARIGTKLANLLGRKYLKVAYIDSVTGSFKWVPVKKEKNRLMLVQ